MRPDVGVDDELVVQIADAPRQDLRGAHLVPYGFERVKHMVLVEEPALPTAAAVEPAPYDHGPAVPVSP